MNSSSINRRSFFARTGAVAGGAAFLSQVGLPEAQLRAADSYPSPLSDAKGTTEPKPTSDGSTRIFAPEGMNLPYKPVVTLNNATLPWKIVDGVKVFHLVAEPVVHEFAPGLVSNCWGYNGRVHGPTIEAVEGDRVRIYVTNRLSAPTTVHWHGILLPNGMDGVGGMSQKAIQSGETFKYEFTLKQHGTCMYHSHHDEMTQMQLGMIGLFIIHPKSPKSPAPDRDYAMLLSEWKIEVGARRPDPNEMTNFNVFSINGRSFPGTAPLLAKVGERVRVRIGNLSTMSHHAIHMHGYCFKVTETDGGEIPEAGQWPETTVFVPTGSTRTIEWVANAQGDWVIHCHMLHHVMTQMGHSFGNLIGINTDGLTKKIKKLVPGYMAMGADGMGDMGDMGMPVPKNSLSMVGAPGQHDYITMGGMFTILKVRDELPADGSDPGWYQAPPGTLATVAPDEDLKRDGIELPKAAPSAALPSSKTNDAICGPAGFGAKSRS
ncbi:MAG TPA: copper oxidase [Candidatus Limnocylindria bacterium]|nr:copper oxidase [Candidatus Limnocylindria bacterium]